LPASGSPGRVVDVVEVLVDVVVVDTTRVVVVPPGRLVLVVDVGPGTLVLVDDVGPRTLVHDLDDDHATLLLGVD
jgi:hypothetical protein